jgi:hypothetical protein
MFHQEAYGVAAFTATKAFINLFAWRNCERWRFFIVEGALSDVVNAPFFQSYKPANNFDDIYPRQYLLYGLLCNQFL